MSSFNLAFTYQLRAIYALLMREVFTRYGNTKLGFIWVILEVLANVAVFSVIKIFIGFPGPDSINVILYLTTGVVPYFYFRNVINRMISAIQSNKGLLAVPGVSFLDFFYARFLLESATVLVTLVIGMIISVIVIKNIDYFYYTGFEIVDITLVLEGILILGLLGFGTGLILAAITSIFKSVALISSVMLRFLYFTSGVIIPIDNRIPYQYHEILYWNPIVHCMEIIRSGFFLKYTPEEYFMDFSYLYSLSLVLIFIGLLMVIRMKKWILR